MPRDLWQCPRCGHRFTHANTWHSCGTADLADHFRGRAPGVKAAYAAFEALVRSCGEVTIIPQKSRIAFQVRMRFAALMPQASALKGHLVLAERHPLACFDAIETFSPRNHVHVFRLRTPADITPEFAECVRLAYRVGAQEHPGRRSSRKS